MFLNRASVCRFKAAWVPPCQHESLARARSGDQDQVEALACDVMAGAGGAAGPAPDVRHQPPGDANEERAQNVLYIHNERKMQHRRVDAHSAVVMPVESMHEITGSNPTVMHTFLNRLEIWIYAYIRVYTHSK
jgi:hypothetical protein